MHIQKRLGLGVLSVSLRAKELLHVLIIKPIHGRSQNPYAGKSYTSIALSSLAVNATAPLAHRLHDRKKLVSCAEG